MAGDLTPTLLPLFSAPQVRVAFGGVWKDSLSELSGGQKSLLALSLILALCRFKPAPIYILDEVDSALDLNHTQNIGRMIKVRYPCRFRPLGLAACVHPASGALRVAPAQDDTWTAWAELGGVLTTRICAGNCHECLPWTQAAG